VALLDLQVIKGQQVLMVRPVLKDFEGTKELLARLLGQLARKE
jgi:hypothetical protein